MPALMRSGSWALPLREISSLACRSAGAGQELLAVGDEAFVLVAAALDAQEAPARPRWIDLGPLLPAEITAAAEGSEWEGVASDGQGNVYVLQEGPARVMGFDPTLERHTATIQLTVDKHEPGFGEQWDGDPNKRAETLVLLTDGHLLVIKQRKPIRFIEFGPANAEPLGLSEGTFLRGDAAFLPDPADVEYTVLASWGVDDETKQSFESVNDASVTADGKLYVLSSRSRRIGRVEVPVGPGEARIAIRPVWDLPDGLPGETPKDRPEGFVLPGGNEAFVAVDTKELVPNLVRVGPLGG
jgi:hypothetical protein